MYFLIISFTMWYCMIWLWLYIFHAIVLPHTTFLTVSNLKEQKQKITLECENRKLNMCVPHNNVMVLRLTVVQVMDSTHRGSSRHSRTILFTTPVCRRVSRKILLSSVIRSLCSWSYLSWMKKNTWWLHSQLWLLGHPRLVEEMACS